MEPTRNGGLADYRVVDLSRTLAGPVPSMFLADMGAQVIKVETRRYLDAIRRGRLVEPEKSEVEQHPQAHNVWRGKLGITLDIAQPEARSILSRLIGVSDVVVESFGPGVLQRLGLGYDRLREIKHDIILMSLKTFTASGPLHAIRGGGPTAHALGGVNSIIGYEDGKVLSLGRYTADLLTGLQTLIALCAALHQRKREGTGQHIEVCLTKSSILAATVAFLEYSFTGRTLKPRGNFDPTMAPYNYFPCLGEDQWVSIAVRTEEQWQGLCEALGNPEWTKEKMFRDKYDRLKNREELERLISPWTREHTAMEVAETLQALGVPAAPLLRAQDRFADPHFQARGLYTWVDHPVLGSEPLFNTMWKMSKTPPQIRGPAPLLGQHNDYVFRALLGMSEKEIDSLTETGVLG